MEHWRNVIDKDFPPLKEVSVKEQNAAFKQARHISNVRLWAGRISTSEELEIRRNRAMKKPLI